MESISEPLNEEVSRCVEDNSNQSYMAQPVAVTYQPPTHDDQEATHKTEEAKVELSTLDKGKQKAGEGTIKVTHLGDQEIVQKAEGDKAQQRKPQKTLEEEQHKSILDQQATDKEEEEARESNPDQENCVIQKAGEDLAQWTEKDRKATLNARSETLRKGDEVHQATIDDCTASFPELTSNLPESESMMELLMVFGVSAKAAAETLIQFVTDKRTVKEKSDSGCGAQVVKALEEVMDICGATQEVAGAVEHLAAYMAMESHILHAFYAFLTIFPG